MAGVTIPLNVIGYQKTKKELEDVKNQLDALNSSADKNNKLSAEQAEQQKELQQQQKALQGALNLTNKAVKEQVMSNQELADSYIFAEDGMLEVTATIGLLEDKMYSMVIAGEQNSDQFKELQQETARLKTVIIEADRSIDTLAENQGIGRVGAGLGIVGERLVTLDFAGAGKEAQILSNNMSNLGDIGSSALKGITKTIGGLSKAFVKMGVALLSNPIFLIVAAVVAIGVAIAALLKKLGILQPILDAIGAVFGWIGDVIDSVVQSIQDFTDWLGLTDSAAEEFAEQQAKNAEKVRKKNEQMFDDFIAGIDQEIRLKQIAGEETVELEIRKQEAYIKTTEVAIRELKAELIARKIFGETSEEDIEKLEDELRQKEVALRDANNEIEVIQAQHNKNRSEAGKQAAEKRKADEEQDATNRLNAQRQLQDLELELLEDGIEKEVEASNIKYQRLIEDTKTSEDLLQSEKKAIIDNYRLLAEAEEDELRKKNTEKVKAAEQKLFEEKIARQDAQFQLLQEIQSTEQEQEIAKLVEEFEAKFELAQGNQELELALEQEQKNRLKELNDKFEEEKTAKQKEEDEKRKESTKQLIDAGVEATTQSLDAISGLNDLIFANKTKNLEKGSAAERAAAKKQFEINKKVQIAQALIQGVQAVLSAYSSGSAIPIVGAVTGPLFAALAAVSVATNIAKIKNQQFEGGGAAPSAPSGGGGAASITAEAQSAAPSFEAFATGAGGEAELSDSAEAGQPIQVNATVSETEVTETQDRIQTINKNAEL
jgi:hypothetical protein